MSVALPAMAVEDDDTIPVDEFVEIVKAEAALGQDGAYWNYVSWTTNSITKKTNSPSSGYITLTVTGTMTTEYTYAGMTFGFSSDHTVTKEINCA